jgi:hypothetical protein
MELEELLVDSSKITADMAVQTIGDNPVLFKKVLDFALEDKEVFAQRASRVIQLTTTKYPYLIEPHLDKIVNSLPGFKNGGLKRNMLRLLAHHSNNLDEEQQSILLDVCFKNLMNSDEKPAVIVYSMDILYDISNQYPELKNELISCIENKMPVGSAGIKSRSKKMLKKLYKETEVGI